MARRLSEKELNKLKFMRKKGKSILEISKILNIPKTTVFYHAKQVKMSSEVLKAWRTKRGGRKNLKFEKEKKAFVEAKKEIGKLSKKEKLLFLSALYWAEGNKKDFMLSNTDPKLIKVFVEGLRNIFEIDDERLKISIRIYEDMDKEKCLTFWSSLIGVPKQKFQNVYILKGKKQGKLKFGMCRVRVTKGGDLLKKVFAINNIVANF